MKQKYRIGQLDVVLCTDKIELDKSQAFIHKVYDDEEYEFDVITCAARPVEFSVVNNLAKLDRVELEEACRICNSTREIGILSMETYHLVLTPFPEKYTFFGEKQAEQLTNDTIDICIELNATRMRITQFCMMRGPMPFYDQFKGIIKALTNRHDSLVDLVYFDVPEDKWMDLTTLFESYNVAPK